MYFVCLAKMAAVTAEEAITALAGRLLDAGHVKASFGSAAVMREKRFPTGLPFEPSAVALPHTDPEHIERSVIGIATLTAPVRFRQMGTPSILLEVRLVLMPAFTSKEHAAAGLNHLVEALQDEAFRAELLGCANDLDLETLGRSRWGEL
jgi:PTS system galactitol-specific IIA component